MGVSAGESSRWAGKPAKPKLYQQLTKRLNIRNSLKKFTLVKCEDFFQGKMFLKILPAFCKLQTACHHNPVTVHLNGYY